MTRAPAGRGARGRAASRRAGLRLGLTVGLLAGGAAQAADPVDARVDEELRAQARRELVATVEELGAAWYERYCSSCHGPEGRGDGPAAAALEPPPSDLTHIAARHEGRFPAGEVIATIDGRGRELAAHGLRDMPVWGLRFGEGVPEARRDAVALARIRAIVEHLRALQAP